MFCSRRNNTEKKRLLAMFNFVACSYLSVHLVLFVLDALLAINWLCMLLYCYLVRKPAVTQTDWFAAVLRQASCYVIKLRFFTAAWHAIARFYTGRGCNRVSQENAILDVGRFFLDLRERNWNWNLSTAVRGSHGKALIIVQRQSRRWADFSEILRRVFPELYTSASENPMFE